MDNSPVNILLVDDVRENLTALEMLLRDPEYTIFCATSGSEALELMLQHEFALAVIDVQMPEMDGFEVAEIMQSTERTRQIPIIFVTAGGYLSASVNKAYQSGAIDFMVKPLDNQAARSKVRIFVELYRQRRALNEKVYALQEARIQQQELLEKMQAIQQELEQAAESRDRFISVVTHELRTPLNTMKLELYARRHYLQAGDMSAFTPERLEEMVESDERQLNRLVRLINDMTDVSRMRSGQLSIQPTRFDVTEMVRRVVRLFASQLQVAKCSANLCAEKSIIIIADEFRIEQAFTNLLTNAIRHCNGNPVDVGVEDADDVVHISVRDRGLGIKAEEQQRIFKLFERGSHERPGSGLGLGLYIATQIVSAHGGDICVESQQGQGALFTIRLPKQPT